MLSRPHIALDEHASSFVMWPTQSVGS